MAGSGLAYQAEHKAASGQAPDELSFLTQIWMNHSHNPEHLSNGSLGVQSSSRPNGTSLPNSPAARTALPPQSTLSASDAILNAGQLRKEPPGRAAGAQSQSGNALLQAFSELPQQQSLKVNTAQLGGANAPRTSLDSQRAPSPFWMKPSPQGSVASQVINTSDWHTYVENTSVRLLSYSWPIAGSDYMLYVLKSALSALRLQIQLQAQAPHQPGYS